MAEILPRIQDETLKCSMSLKVTQEAVTDLCIESRVLLASGQLGGGVLLKEALDFLFIEGDLKKLRAVVE